MSSDIASFDLEQAVQDANKLVGCRLCKGIRFKPCLSCGQSVNSFRDFREVRPQPVYRTVREWIEVNGEQEQNIPDRPLQP